MSKLLAFLCVALWMLPMGSNLAADDAPLTSSDSAQTGLSAVDARTDPRSGVPVAPAVSPPTLAAHPDDIYWDTTISYEIGGGFVLSLNGYGWLTAGWDFNGARWHEMYSWWEGLGGQCGIFGGYGGPNGSVLALAVYKDRLVAGGGFTLAGCYGGYTANHIWVEPYGWSQPQLGSGLSGPVRALTVYDGNLIAGGTFDTAGGVPAGNIAAWDGTSWSPLGSGMDGPVLALTVHDGNLIAGGLFTTAGGAGANRIAAWNGSSWSPYGLGMATGHPYDLSVSALTVYDSKLIAGGTFDTAGGVPASNIAAWDGSSWSALGSGMNLYGSVRALAVYGNQLIAGGDFFMAGGVLVNHIAAWDGSSWSGLGSGTNSTSSVFALTVYGGNLIAGGNFTTAGNKVAFGVARWTKYCTDGSSPDYDNDGVANACDNCALVNNPGQADADEDGVGDACDNCLWGFNPSQADTDGDGAADGCDNCSATANPNQANADHDSFGDACDNCPSVADDSQANADADSLGDACDNCPAVMNSIQGITVTMTGDLNQSGTYTSSDVILLVNYVFKGGAVPAPCEASGDVNCSGSVTSADIITFVNHVFKSGPVPCNVCTALGLGWSCP